jgi:hypothetical protein
VGRHLGGQIKLRSAGMTTLRIVSPFNMDLRRLLRGAPNLEAHLNQPPDAFMNDPATSRRIFPPRCACAMASLMEERG